MDCEKSENAVKNSENGVKNITKCTETIKSVDIIKTKDRKMFWRDRRDKVWRYVKWDVRFFEEMWIVCEKK